MKIPKIAEAMGEIDADLVSASAKERRRAKQPWIKWSILTAACLCVIIVAGMIVVPLMLDDDVLPEGYYPTGKVISMGDLKRHYKYSSVASSEMGVIWADEYLTASEKHNVVLWNFKSYDSSGNTVQTRHLGDKLGNYLGFEVRSIDGVSEDAMIAVGMEGDWYVYKCRDALLDMPETLGELFDRYGLSEAWELDRFTEHEGRNETHYALDDDAYILEVLASCHDAKRYEDTDKWQRSDEYLSFTMTSDRLGVYKKVMYITKDGYLRTNVFEYAYIYEIGEEAAGKIIEYAMANSVKKSFEPYEYTLAGTVVDIKDGFVYIDDSILCVKPSEGMVFRVSLEDIRIRRCVECGMIDVGDLVVVTFRGGIAVEDGNLILDARSIDEGYLSEGGGVAVPE